MAVVDGGRPGRRFVHPPAAGLRAGTRGWAPGCRIARADRGAAEHGRGPNPFSTGQKSQTVYHDHGAVV